MHRLAFTCSASLANQARIRQSDRLRQLITETWYYTLGSPYTFEHLPIFEYYIDPHTKTWMVKTNKPNSHGSVHPSISMQHRAPTPQGWLTGILQVRIRHERSPIDCAFPTSRNPQKSGDLERVLSSDTVELVETIIILNHSISVGLFFPESHVKALVRLSKKHPHGAFKSPISADSATGESKVVFGTPASAASGLGSCTTSRGACPGRCERTFRPAEVPLAPGSRAGWHQQTSPLTKGLYTDLQRLTSPKLSRTWSKSLKGCHQRSMALSCYRELQLHLFRLESSIRMTKQVLQMRETGCVSSTAPPKHMFWAQVLFEATCAPRAVAASQVNTSNHEKFRGQQPESLSAKRHGSTMFYCSLPRCLNARARSSQKMPVPSVSHNPCWGGSQGPGPSPPVGPKFLPEGKGKRRQRRTYLLVTVSMVSTCFNVFQP